MKQAIETRTVSAKDLPVRRYLAFFLVAAGFLFFIFVFFKSIDRTIYPIEKISVEGKLEKLDPSQVEQVVIDAVEGGFFHLNLETVRRSLIEEPWIAKAIVTRVWPRSLHVRVLEHAAIAHWGKDSLLSTEGDIFTPRLKEESSDLVTLIGPIGMRFEMLKVYESVSLRMSKIGISLSSIVLSDRGSWSFLTSSGLSLICGRGDVLKKIDRLILALEKGLLNYWPEASKIDMRYTNGLSITLVDSQTRSRMRSVKCMERKCPRRKV